MPWGRIRTEWGVFHVAWDSQGVTRLLFPNQPCPEPLHESDLLDGLAKELGEYLEGERPGFTVPLSLDASAFSLEVWEALCAVPYGETVTYGELAAGLGRPGAGRAVGRAVAINPVPILIPCHRVVGKRGLGGFGPGLDWKERILSLERAHRSKFSPR